jgi:hypothetical protein
MNNLYREYIQMGILEIYMEDRKTYHFDAKYQLFQT